MRKGVFVFLLIFVGVVVLSGFVSAECYEIRDANGNDLHFGDRDNFLEAAGDAPFGCDNHGGDDRHCLGYSDCSIEGGVEDLESGAISGGEKVFDGCTYDLENFADLGEEVVSTGVKTNIGIDGEKCDCVFEGVGDDEGKAEGPIKLLNPTEEICSDFQGSEIGGCTSNSLPIWEKEFDISVKKTGRECVYAGVPNGMPGFGECGEGGSLCAIGGGPNCAAEDCQYREQCTIEFYEESDLFNNKKQSERKYFHNIEPKVNLILDPKYVDDTEESRLFRPTSITPFDNVICQVKIPVSGLDTCNSKIEGLEIEGELVLVDIDGVEVEVIKEGIVGYDRKEEGNYIFEWKIKGWPYGWTDNEITLITDEAKLERIVKTISEGGDVRCDIKAESGDVIVVNEEGTNAHAGLCVQLWGKKNIPFFLGHGRISTMRSKSSGLSVFDLIFKGKFDMEAAHSADPFGSDKPVPPLTSTKFKEVFTYFVDLKEHDDSNWLLKADGMFDPITSWEDPDLNAYTYIDEKRSCGGTSIDNMYTVRGIKIGVPAYARGPHYIFSRPDIPSKTVVHETGHAYCGLSDEYVYDNYRSSLGKNCRGNPSFGQFGEPYEGCTNLDEYRPSWNSMMKYQYALPKFNIISCGYCLSKIQPQISFTNHLAYCRDNLDVIQVGVQCTDSTNTGNMNSGCNLGDTRGCGVCDSQGVCDYTQNNGNECIKKVPGVPGDYNVGICSGAVCNINENWECTDRFSWDNECFSNQICDTQAHVCVPCINCG